MGRLYNISVLFKWFVANLLASLLLTQTFSIQDVQMVSIGFVCLLSLIKQDIS